MNSIVQCLYLGLLLCATKCWANCGNEEVGRYAEYASKKYQVTPIVSKWSDRECVVLAYKEGSRFELFELRYDLERLAVDLRYDFEEERQLYARNHNDFVLLADDALLKRVKFFSKRLKYCGNPRMVSIRFQRDRWHLMLNCDSYLYTTEISADWKSVKTFSSPTKLENHVPIYTGPLPPCGSKTKKGKLIFPCRRLDVDTKECGDSVSSISEAVTKD